MDRDGSERYSRCAKSIVQIGPADAGPQGQVSKPVGLPLEIVPEANLYTACSDRRTYQFEFFTKIVR
jgi:hypothetical protein